MLLNRIRPHLDDKLRPNQCGFREKRSFYSVDSGIEKKYLGYRRQKSFCSGNFHWFQGSFRHHPPPRQNDQDTESLWQPRHHSPCNWRYLPYQGTKAKVNTSDGDTDDFDILSGVLQGDIVLDYCLRSASKGYCLRSASKGNKER